MRRLSMASSEHVPYSCRSLLSRGAAQREKIRLTDSETPLSGPAYFTAGCNAVPRRRRRPARVSRLEDPVWARHVSIWTFEVRQSSFACPDILKFETDDRLAANQRVAPTFRGVASNVGRMDQRPNTSGSHGNATPFPTSISPTFALARRADGALQSGLGGPRSGRVRGRGRFIGAAGRPAGSGFTERPLR